MQFPICDLIPVRDAQRCQLYASLRHAYCTFCTTSMLCCVSKIARQATADIVFSRASNLFLVHSSHTYSRSLSRLSHEDAFHLYYRAIPILAFGSLFLRPQSSFGLLPEAFTLDRASSFDISRRMLPRRQDNCNYSMPVSNYFTHASSKTS